MAIALDADKNVYVAGQSGGEAFPIAGAVQNGFGGQIDAFFTKINASGSAIEYSSYLGGAEAETATGLALNPAGNVFITGYTNSIDFPLKKPFQDTLAGERDAFVVKLGSYRIFLR